MHICPKCSKLSDLPHHYSSMCIYMISQVLKLKSFAFVWVITKVITVGMANMVSSCFESVISDFKGIQEKTKWSLQLCVNICRKEGTIFPLSIESMFLKSKDQQRHSLPNSKDKNNWNANIGMSSSTQKSDLMWICSKHLLKTSRVYSSEMRREKE